MIRPSRNTGVPKMPDPHSAYPILVSRGEPHRTDEQMREIMAVQVVAFTNATAPEFAMQPEVVVKAIALISGDHIDAPGTQAVMLSADHVRAYLRVAQEQRGSDAEA